ncbi:MAG: vWA domain-containing protein [Rikenellaceae bacterium]
MNINRLFFALIGALLFVNVADAQNSQYKDERRIYMWDVTLSMQGYQDKTPDIFDKVVTAIKADINSITDEQTEIVILPYQTKVLDVFSTKATPEGLKALNEFIDAAKTKYKDVTYTNICAPLEEVMMKHLNDSRRNMLILMTDGIQNDPGTSEADLLAAIKKWCSIAPGNDAHAFYVMLTEHAQNPRLIEVIKNACRIGVVTTGEGGEIILTFVELLSQNRVLYNIKEDADKKIRLTVECKKRVEIPEDMKIEIKVSDNPYVELDQESAIKNGAIELEIKLKQPYEELKSILPTDENLRLNVRMEIEDEEKYPLARILNDNFTLELINKPEKTLKLYVKD